ncbi:GHKL domain-containing protein [Vallitaleaceae bacterium 9-2]
MTYIETLILSFFDMLMLTYIIVILKASLKKIDVIKGCCGVLVGTALIGTVIYFVSNQVVSFTVNIIIAFVLIQIIMRSDLKRITITYVYSLTILCTVQLLTTIAYQLIKGSWDYTFVSSLITQLITAVMTIVILKILPINQFYHSLIKENKWMQIVVTNVFFVYYVLVILWNTDLYGLLDSILGILILVVIILLINTLMITHGISNQILSEKIKMYDMYFPVIEDIIEEVRTKQHDYHNHIQTLYALKSMEHLPNAFEEYLQTIKADDIWMKLIRLDNKVLMAFLYSKFLHAQKDKINVEFKIQNYFFNSELQDYELIEIFGILMDNSIEATLEVEARGCEILIGYEEGLNIIQTRNQATAMLNDRLIKTLKSERKRHIKDKTGYGLQKLTTIVNRYKGQIKIKYNKKDQEIICRVEIPDSSN